TLPVPGLPAASRRPPAAIRQLGVSVSRAAVGRAAALSPAARLVSRWSPPVAAADSRAREGPLRRVEPRKAEHRGAAAPACRTPALEVVTASGSARPSLPDPTPAAAWSAPRDRRAA